MIFPSSEAYLALSILKNHLISTAKRLEKKKKNITIIFYYLNGRFWNQKCSQCGGEISWPTFYVTVNSKSDSKIEACETIAVHAHAIYAN